MTSMPKAGTHLLLAIAAAVAKPKRLLKLDKNQDIAPYLGEDILLSGHHRYDTIPNFRVEDWRTLVLIRDPRDVVLSMRDFLEKNVNVDHRRAYSTIAALDKDAQLKAIISGIKLPHFKVGSIRDHCSGWIEWRKLGATIVRYEDILDQSASQSIADCLGYEPSVVSEAIRANVGQKTPTMNVGTSLRWASEMSEEVLAFFEREAGDVRDLLGYDKTTNNRRAVAGGAPRTPSRNGRPADFGTQARRTKSHRARSSDLEGDALLKAVEAAPSDPARHLDFALYLFAHRRFEEAVSELRTAQSLGDTRYKVVFTLAQALFRLGRFEEAIPCFREALRLRPGRASVLRLLGQALDRVGQSSEALEALEGACAADPTNEAIMRDYSRLREHLQQRQNKAQ